MGMKLTFRSTEPKPVRVRWATRSDDHQNVGDERVELVDPLDVIGEPAVTAADLATVFEMGRRAGAR